MTDQAVGQVDYHALLMKYIQHVVDCEGISFLEEWQRSKYFSDEEWAELQRLDRQLFDVRPNPR